MGQSEQKGWHWGRGSLAVLLSILFLGIVLPNTGRVVLDHTTTPPTAHIVGRVRDSFILIGMVTVPLVCILLGMFRWPRIEIIGWVLLVVLVGLAFTK
jgi:hypothetical protein